MGGASPASSYCRLICPVPLRKPANVRWYPSAALKRPVSGLAVDVALTPHKTRWRLIMGLMIPLMAALTPDDYEVALCDERLEGINWDGGWNLVGMTTTIGEFLPPTTLAIKTTSPGTAITHAPSTVPPITRQWALSNRIESGEECHTGLSAKLHK